LDVVAVGVFVLGFVIHVVVAQLTEIQRNGVTFGSRHGAKKTNNPLGCTQAVCNIFTE
jgi:hypothetical protein